MNKKLYYAIILMFFFINMILAQDPPPLPDAPNQGPISGLYILAIGGMIIAVKKYFDRTR
jgi:hypothetical protein